MMTRSDFVLGTFAFTLGLAGVSQADSAGGYVQHNLVANTPGVADHTDVDLTNPWGLVLRKDNAFQIALNHSGKSAAYKFTGAFDDTKFNVPGPGGTGTGSPTGIVSNDGPGFVICKNDKHHPSRFILSTEDGIIAGWNRDVDPDSAIVAVDRSDTGAVYKGLAKGNIEDKTFIYATNFNAGVVEIYNEQFKLVKTFTDPGVDAGFAPFGIENIHGKLYVTFAKQDAQKHDDEAGPGNGFVDVFSLKGKLIRRLISHGALNSPWGVALAPHDFGKWSDHLLIGNFGDGRINVYDIDSGEFDSALKDPHGHPIEIPGLWGLRFARGKDDDGDNDWSASLFFTSGPGDENDGLFGKLTPQKKD